MFANSSSGPAEHLMQLAGRFSQAFPNGSPETLVASTQDQLSLAGVNDGNYSRPDCVNLTRDYEIVQAAMSGYLRQPGRTLDMGNNWTLVNSPDEYHFVDTVEGLAWISNSGYLPLMPREALYPFLGFTPRLESGEAFLLKFSGRPPVRQDGFWSVTMYSQDGYLVDNPIDRYLISDRNELSYPNGTLVYSSGGQAFSAPVTAIEDAPFQILIQADAPPQNWTSNWLPSPQEPGNFTVALRWYGPTEPLKDHSYIYPLLEKVAAVSAQANSTGAPSSTPSASAGQSGATSTPNSAPTMGIFAIGNQGTAVLQLAILVSSIVFYQTFV
ncbi:uncharacterized protein A1O9_08608 [Exophiala aquamarina CBS 119918]|uniref:DUF1214 domain-containing protein n=1 Tax=Exophiala aquamarina CBS 119918 TaxID=1182545 RepID=A0A072P516_9EURO|nr:uncharacterized protein A1O9_08608 [Exophiala aquamarina CBS 119918]KEF54956.1 hypothetical protein A1O9_08608 [Exophiala aquamarina CBS 119918]